MSNLKIKLHIKQMFLTFHLEMSGNEINEEHPQNKKDILNTFAVFHFEISGISFKDLQS